MELRFSAHALLRMGLREIGQEQVRAVLARPQWTPSTHRNTRYDGMVGGRRLAVIVAEEHQPPVVVTLWWYDERRE